MEFATIVRLNWDNRSSETARCVNTERSLTHPSDYTGRQAVTKRTCAIDACDKPSASRGWCNGHYLRWRRHGDPEGGSKRQPRIGTCLVDGCDLKVSASQLCSAHYQRRRATGQLGDAEVRQRAPGPCSFEGCDSPSEAKTLCAAHRWQQKQGRELTALGRQISLTSRDEHGRKYCAACRDWKDESEFGTVASRPDGRAHKCRRCVRDANLRTNFGISLVRYEQILAAQGGVCAICQQTNRDGRALAVDHDHSCCPGKRSCSRCVRALLCGMCNLVLGYVNDSPERLRAAADFIEKHRRGDV